jgi:hypothetical protein
VIPEKAVLKSDKENGDRETHGDAQIIPAWLENELLLLQAH